MSGKLFYLFIVSLIFTTVTAVNAQSLNWHLTAQAGTLSTQHNNFQGAFLAGFESLEGQQLSFGPVVKGYMANKQIENTLGGRVYSQAKVVNNLSLYIQCDVFNGVKSQITHTRAPIRLESGAGFIYTVYERIGISAGYNFGEYNPLSGIRKNSPSVKLVYLVPLTYNQRW